MIGCVLSQLKPFSKFLAVKKASAFGLNLFHS